MSKETFLLLNLALAFYNVGTIWAHETDIFRSWKPLDPETFHTIQSIHWRKLPFWIFIPLGMGLAGSIALIWFHPDPIPVSEPWIALALQITSHFLTAIFWGPWQARLSRDPSGGASPYLDKILKTHWIRTMLINAYGFMLLLMAIQTLS